MSFLLDTDTCSAYLRGDPRLWQRFLQYDGQLHISAMSAAELFTWARRRKSPKKRLPALYALFDVVTLIEIDRIAAEQFGLIRAAQLDQGRTVSAPDLLNAAVALVHQFTMVTHNRADYADIPGLTLADWLTE